MNNRKVGCKGAGVTSGFFLAATAVITLSVTGCAYRGFEWGVDDSRLGQSLAAAKDAQRASDREIYTDEINARELRPSTERYLAGRETLAGKDDAAPLLSK